MKQETRSNARNYTMPRHSTCHVEGETSRQSSVIREGSLQAQVYREQDCRRYEHSKAVVRAIGPMVSNVGKAPISISSQIQYHCEAFCEAINGVNS